MVTRKHFDRYSDQQSHSCKQIYYSLKIVFTLHIISVLAHLRQIMCRKKIKIIVNFLQNILHVKKNSISLHSHLDDGEIAQLVRAHDS